MSSALKPAKTRLLHPPIEILSLPASPNDATLPPVSVATFGGGNTRFRRAALKLANDAIRCRWFDRVALFTDEDARPSGLVQAAEWHSPDLPPDDRLFIAQRRRGHGYWLWKPILVASMLESMPEGSILVYADGGCEFSHLGARRFRQYLALAHEYGGLFFRIPHKEADYSKRETLDHLAASEEERQSDQIQATLFLIKNTRENRQLVQQWLAICRHDDKRLLSDEHNPAAQVPTFIDHRHDQSILSILVKRSIMKVIDREDTFDKRLYRIINSWIFLFPFHARRGRNVRLTPLIGRLSSESACRRSIGAPLSFRAQFLLQSMAGGDFAVLGLREMFRPRSR